MISQKKPKVVCLGGGTGLPVVLNSLKNRAQLSAIVNMVDDGRSSGILRRRYSVPPVGDLRNSLVALAKNKKLARVMSYRFERGPLSPHPVGNIMLVSAVLLFRKEDNSGVQDAVNLFSELLEVEGKVIPVCSEQVELVGMTAKGRVVRGQVNVSHTRGIKKVWVEPELKAEKEAAEEVKKADFIIVCPGSLYSSILPVLITGGLYDVFKKSNAKKIWIMNLANERNETYRYSTDDYVKAFKRHFGDFRFDYVICQKPLKKFTEFKRLVKLNIEGLSEISDRIIIEDVADNKNPWIHDPKKLAKVLGRIISREEG